MSRSSAASRRKRGTGFTILEVVIALVMLAVLSAAVIPALMGRIRDAQTATLSQTLFSLSLAITEYRKAVTTYPPALKHLALRPSATVTDACGTAIGSTNSASWRGPYVSRELVAGGLNIGDASVADTLRRDAGPPVTLFIDVGNVDSLSAIDIDKQFDGATNTPTTGAIRYQKAAIPPAVSAATAGFLNLSYAIPITGC